MAVIIDSALTISATALNVLPVVLFLFVFQRFVLKHKFANLGRLLVGFGCVVLGLGLFLIGLGLLCPSGAMECLWQNA